MFLLISFVDLVKILLLHITGTTCSEKKNRPKKFPFVATNNWITLAVWQKKRNWKFQRVCFYKQTQKLTPDLNIYLGKTIS